MAERPRIITGTGATKSRPVSITPSSPSRTVARSSKSKGRWPWYLGGGLVACAGLVVIYALASIAGGDGSRLAPEASSGILPKDLSIVSQVLTGAWEEQDTIENDKLEWFGSAGVLREDKAHNKLVLVTNSHCLGLKELAEADTPLEATIEVRSYGLQVTFLGPDGTVTRNVERFAGLSDSRDLALLEVDATGLVAGKHYVLLPYNRSVAMGLKNGDPVVAVGAPHGMVGSQTYGRVSQFRESEASNMPCPREKAYMIQVDAALNPGNSGGPLLAEYQGRYYWVGVNTLKWAGENLNGAIVAEQVSASNFTWFKADKSGAAESINTTHKGRAVVVP